RHAGPTAVMRAEHIEIRAAVQMLRAAIDDPSADTVRLRERLHATLGPHSVKEERILYPMIDRVLSELGSDELVAAIQAYESR
ncbi:MAG: hemerythrin domain-containing protein, partial [Acidobacteriota bacterium]